MPPLPSLVRRRPDDKLSAPLSAFESDTAAVLLRTAPRREPAIVHLIALFLIVAVVLMSVVKLDKVVPGSGKIVPMRGSIYITPLALTVSSSSGFTNPQGAIVRDIKVRLGQVVSKGQVLATLDPTFTTADLNQLRSQLASGEALTARLEAEKDGRPYTPSLNAGAAASAVSSSTVASINTSPALSEAALADQAALLQARLYSQRQAEYQSNVRNFDAQIRADTAIISKAQRDSALYSQRLGLASQYETMETTLEKHGFGSKLKTITARDARAEIQRLLSDAQNLAIQSQHDRDAIVAQRQVYIDHWHSDVASNLVDARNTLDQTRQNLSKATRVHDLISLTAPEDSIVLDIAKTSVGSVITSNDQQPLITLTPLSGPLEVEVQVAPIDVAFIRIGDPVEIRLDAYDFSRYGLVKGVVKTLSDGSFTTEDNGQAAPAPYFKARVTITAMELHDIPKDFRLMPGMTLSGDIIVGKRTIMTYLIQGGLRGGGNEKMREDF